VNHAKEKERRTWVRSLEVSGREEKSSLPNFFPDPTDKRGGTGVDKRNKSALCFAGGCLERAMG